MYHLGVENRSSKECLTLFTHRPRGVFETNVGEAKRPGNAWSRDAVSREHKLTPLTPHPARCTTNGPWRFKSATNLKKKTETQAWRSVTKRDDTCTHARELPRRGFVWARSNAPAGCPSGRGAAPAPWPSWCGIAPAPASPPSPPGHTGDRVTHR